MEKKPISIDRCLGSDGVPYYFIEISEKFYTLKDLKKYYGITKVKKDKVVWALRHRSQNKVYMQTYIAYI